jgi:hypothetical protein
MATLLPTDINVSLGAMGQINAQTVYSCFDCCYRSPNDTGFGVIINGTHMINDTVVLQVKPADIGYMIIDGNVDKQILPCPILGRTTILYYGLTTGTTNNTSPVICPKSSSVQLKPVMRLMVMLILSIVFSLSI